MAGRIARGEVWQFEELTSETSLRAGGRLVYLDRFHLKPHEQSPTAEWKMGVMHYLATGQCYDPRASELAGCLHELLPTAGVDTPASSLLAVRLTAACGPDFHYYRSSFADAVQSHGESQCKSLRNAL